MLCLCSTYSLFHFDVIGWGDGGVGGVRWWWHITGSGKRSCLAEAAQSVCLKAVVKAIKIDHKKRTVCWKSVCYYKCRLGCRLGSVAVSITVPLSLSIINDTISSWVVWQICHALIVDCFVGNLPSPTKLNRYWFSASYQGIMLSCVLTVWDGARPLCICSVCWRVALHEWKCRCVYMFVKCRHMNAAWMRQKRNGLTFL